MNNNIQKKFLYLSLSKLHRNMANLIQTLKTSQAIFSCYKNFEIILPPFKSKRDYGERLKEIGISPTLPVKFSTFLHSRWKPFNFFLFILLNKKTLLNSYVYVRSHYLSKGLIQFKIPHIFEIHDVDKLLDDKFIPYLKSGLQKNIVKKIVAISPILKENLVSLGILPEDISVIQSGVDYEYFSKINIPDFNNNLTLLHIGTLTKDRGSNIINDLAKKGFKIILAGKKDDSIINHPNINYIGFISPSEVHNIYSMGQIALIPYQESLDTLKSCSPLKLMESMAAGRIIIASALKPIQDVVTNGKEALLVPPSNISAWVEAIETVKRNPNLALTLAENARNKAKMFDWKIRAKKIISLFNEDLVP